MDNRSMSRRKILLCEVKTPFIHGGAEYLTNELFNNLVKYGFMADRIALPICSTPRRELLSGAMAWRSLDLSAFEEMSPDVVITSKFPAYTINHPQKIVWLFHQIREVYDLFNTDYYSFANNPADIDIRKSIVSIDNKTLAEAKKIYTISKNISKRLKRYNNLDSTVLYPPPPLNPDINQSKTGNYILTVGRLEPIKRIDLLIKAMNQTNSKLEAIIVGDGPLYSMIEYMIATYGLGHRVKLLRNISDTIMLELYQNCLGVFFAPYDEDYGFVTIEAFKAGKPVVTCYDSGGPLEFVQNGETGFVCNPEPGHVADRMTQLLEKKKTVKRMGENGFERIKSINWNNVVETLIQQSENI